MLLVFALLACGDEPAAPPEPPDVRSEAPAVVDAPTEPVKRPEARWPLFGIASLPLGAKLPLAGAPRDVAMDPRGNAALVLTEDQVLVWSFQGPARALQPDASLGDIVDVEFSPFDASLFAITHDADWRILRLRLDGDALREDAVLYRSEAPLGDLVTARVRFDNRERLFFSREHSPERRQILSVTSEGTRVYEVSSPSGTLGALTDPTIRTPPEEYILPPRVTRADHARPLSMDAATGTLLWTDGGTRVHELPYDELNWGDSIAGERPVEWARHAPNGYLVLEGTSGSFTVYDPARGAIGTVEHPYAGVLAVSPDGRSFLGRTGEGLEVAALPVRGVATRYLDSVDADTRTGLDKVGYRLGQTTAYNDQLYKFYEEVLYEPSTAPMVLSIDAMLEVLHAGFQAVFVGSERARSAPALRAFAESLEKSADPQLAEVGEAVRRTLDGDLDHPEGRRITAGVAVRSPLFDREIDYGDFKPRGPYAADPALRSYFMAFKLMNSLRLSPAQREALGRDAATVSAWKAWVGAQSAFLQGSRQQGALGEALPAAPWSRPDCLPKELVEDPFRLFPLNWGPDSEVLERSVAHDRLPEACGVPRRGLPSGLDLLAGLGSAHARALLAAEYAQFPALEAVHAELARTWQGGVPDQGLAGLWLRLLQTLATDARVPEGVDPATWRNRLSETALGSWVNLRHTLVLVNEISAAEAGEGGPDGFELISFEPPRDVVDPVPESWAALARGLDALAEEAKRAESGHAVPDLLTSAAVSARRLEDMARRQMRGEGLTEEEYEQLHWYVRTVEEPYRLLLTAASGRSAEDYVAPDPVMKIVDVHDWNEPGQPKKVLHVALGRPRVATWLLTDRGVLTPATGAFYGYYEVVTEAERLDDTQWRERVGDAARPRWVNDPR